MENKFSLNRSWYLLKRDISIYKKNIFLYLTVSLAICLLASYLIPYSRSFNFAIYRVYTPVILGIFIVLISLSFSELDSTEKRISYLLIPATQKEKYVTRIIVTLLGYLFLAVIIYAVNSYFVFMLSRKYPLYFNNSFNLFKDIDELWENLRFYFLLHSVFFFGSVAFNKNSFLKTSVLCLIFIAVIVIILKIMTLIFIPNVQVSLALTIDDSVFYYSEEAFKQFRVYKNLLSNVSSFIIFYILPPFFWVLGYFRLKENEVKNGI